MRLSSKFLIFISVINIGFAQSNARYNLDECIRIAVINNYDIQRTASALEISKADVKNAYGNLYLPSVNFTASGNRQLKESGINSFSMNASANYNIFEGFASESNYSRAKNNLEYYEQQSKFREKQVSLDVFKGYTDIVKNMQIIKVREENLKTGQKELERIDAQYKAGTSPVVDVYAQEAELGSRELDLVTAENNLNISKSNLLNIMGREPDTEVQFDETSLPSDITGETISQFRAKFGSLDDAIKKALNTRIDYLAYNSDLQALNASIDAAKSGYYPTVTASGGWSWANSEFSGFGDRGAPYLGLNLRVPIFENYRTDYQVESAMQQANQRQIDKLQLEQSIRLSVKTQFLSLAAAEKQLEISARALKSAEKNFEAARENYSVGTYNITDFLNANYQVVNARINRINTVYNYYLVQRELLFIIGL